MNSAIQFWRPTSLSANLGIHRLTAKNRDQLRKPMLGNRVWMGYLYLFTCLSILQRLYLINRIALAEYRFLYCSSKVITQELRQNYHSDLMDITFTKIRQQIDTAKNRRLIKIEKCLRSHLHSITPSLRIFSNGSLVSIGSPITALIQLRISIFCSASASFVNIHCTSALWDRFSIS